MKFSHLLLAILLIFLWTTDAIGTKYLACSHPAFAILAIKYGLCAIFTLPLHKKTDVPVIHLWSLSFIYTILHIGTWIWAAGTGLYLSVLTFIEVLATPITIIIGTTLLRERLSKTALVGILTAFLGAIIIISEPDKGHIPSYPTAALVTAFISTVSWSMYNCYIGHLERKYTIDHAALLAWISLTGFIQAAILFLIFNRGYIAEFKGIALIDTLAVFNSVITTLLLHLILYFLLKRYTVSRVATIFLLAPFTDSFSAHLIFYEPLHAKFIIGGCVICLGIILSNRGRITVAVDN